jgi:hypothetical protein
MPSHPVYLESILKLSPPQTCLGLISFFFPLGLEKKGVHFSAVEHMLHDLPF